MGEILTAALITRIGAINSGYQKNLPELKRSDLVRPALGLAMLVTVFGALITGSAGLAIEGERGRLIAQRSLHSFPAQKLAIFPGIAYISPSSNNQESPQ